MTEVMQLVFTNLTKPVLDAAKTLPAEELPKLCADLEEVRCTALARLTAPSAPAPVAPDELLTTAQAASFMHCSKVYLYKNASALPFTRRLGKKLLFSRNAIEEFLRKQE